MFAFLEVLWAWRNKNKQPKWLLFDGKADKGLVKTEPITGKVDKKLYAPLKKGDVKEFPELKGVVEIDSDSE